MLLLMLLLKDDIDVVVAEDDFRYNSNDKCNPLSQNDDRILMFIIFILSYNIIILSMKEISPKKSNTVMTYINEMKTVTNEDGHK